MPTRWLLALAVVLGGRPVTAAPDLFRGQVAPLLEKRCLGCHDGAKKRGGLDLSTRAGALAGGDSGPALVPGSAARSRLVEFVSGAKPRMPRSGAKLTAEEVALLQRWIAAGAAWPKEVVLRGQGVWWSLRPLV